MIHFAWPDVSARCWPVMPSSATGRNGTPGGCTGWTFAANSRVTASVLGYIRRPLAEKDRERSVTLPCV